MGPVANILKTFAILRGKLPIRNGPFDENVTVGQWLGVAHRGVFRGDCAIDGQD